MANNDEFERICIRCSYDLRGSPSNVCPECGDTWEAARARSYSRLIGEQRRTLLILKVTLVIAPLLSGIGAALLRSRIDLGMLRLVVGSLCVVGSLGGLTIVVVAGIFSGILLADIQRRRQGWRREYYDHNRRGIVLGLWIAAGALAILLTTFLMIVALVGRLLS